MSTNVQFFSFLHHFGLAKLATTSIRVKQDLCQHSANECRCVLTIGVSLKTFQGFLFHMAFNDAMPFTSFRMDRLTLHV